METRELTDTSRKEDTTSKSKRNRSRSTKTTTTSTTSPPVQKSNRFTRSSSSTSTSIATSELTNLNTRSLLHPEISNITTKSRPLNRTASLPRTASYEYILSDSGSDTYSGDDDDDAEFLKIYSSERRRLSSSQICCKLDNLEKEEVHEMLEAVESTFTHLNKRTNNMFETLERVNKKHHKTHNELKNFIDVIKEMKEETKALLKRQEKISKDYTLVEQVISGSRPASTLNYSSSYQPPSRSQGRNTESTRKYDISDEEDVPVRRTVPKKYDISDDEDEIDRRPPPKKYDFSDEEDIRHTEPKKYDLSDEENKPADVQSNADDTSEMITEQEARSIDDGEINDVNQDQYVEKGDDLANDDKPSPHAIESDEEKEEELQPRPQEEIIEDFEEAEKSADVTDDRTQSEVESDDEWERKEMERKRKQDEQNQDQGEEEDQKEINESASGVVDHRTQSEIESDEEWEQQQQQQQQQEAQRPSEVVDDRTPSEIESDEEWERREIERKQKQESELNKADSDEESALQAAQKELENLSDGEE